MNPAFSCLISCLVLLSDASLFVSRQRECTVNMNPKLGSRDHLGFLALGEPFPKETAARA